MLSHFRKQTDLLKKEPAYKKPNLNHTEYAYREAVNRLKCMLADSYTSSRINTFRRHGYESDDTDNVSAIERPALSEISKYVPSNNVSRYNAQTNRRFYSPQSYLHEQSGLPAIKSAESIGSIHASNPYPICSATATAQAPPELIHFIEKQEGYIEQLERESQFCRV